jgi:hypothetical protein
MILNLHYFLNKHEHISVGFYWNDVGVPGWKLSGWSNTRATVSPKNCKKYNRSTLAVARCLHSCWDRRVDAGCCVLRRAPAQERLRKSEGPTPRCTYIITVMFFANKQNRDAQTHERGGSVVFGNIVTQRNPWNTLHFLHLCTLSWPPCRQPLTCQ